MKIAIFLYTYWHCFYPVIVRKACLLINFAGVDTFWWEGTGEQFQPAEATAGQPAHQCSAGKRDNIQRCQSTRITSYKINVILYTITYRAHQCIFEWY